MSTREIHERIYAYVLNVVRILVKLPRTYVNQILIGQLIRSITSVGAYDQEADGTMSKADFIHCYTTVRKERKESLYWLRLLSDCNPLQKEYLEFLISEGTEIK